MKALAGRELVLRSNPSSSFMSDDKRFSAITNTNNKQTGATYTRSDAKLTRTRSRRNRLPYRKWRTSEIKLIAMLRKGLIERMHRLWVDIGKENLDTSDPFWFLWQTQYFKVLNLLLLNTIIWTTSKTLLLQWEELSNLAFSVTSASSLRCVRPYQIASTGQDRPMRLLIFFMWIPWVVSCQDVQNNWHRQRNEYFLSA